MVCAGHNMKKNLRGFALITSVLIISILIPLVIAYIARVTAEYRFTSKFYNSIAAFNLAEAGIERALWEINYNDSVKISTAEAKNNV